MPRRLATLLVGLAAAVAADPAVALTVEGVPDSRIDPAHVRIEGSGGAADRVSVDATIRRITVRSQGGGPLTPAGDCRAVGPRAVRCPGGYQEILIRTGRGDDRVTAAVPRNAGNLWVDTGAGDDDLQVVKGGSVILYGGRGRDVIRGGPRADHIDGGPGADRLYGRRGDDVLAGEGNSDPRLSDVDIEPGTAPDRLDGGPGRDRAGWFERRAGVRVDLESGRGGGDRLRSIEGAIGGDGNDVLRGDRGPNVLQGGLGADRLAGGAGDDRLNAGSASVLREGENDRTPDGLRCGAGDDVVVDAGITDEPLADADVLPRDCERLWASPVSAIGPRPLRIRPRGLPGRRLRVGVSCDSSEPCRRRVTLLLGGRVVGTRSVRSRKAFDSVVVRLRRRVPRGSVLTVRATGNDFYVGSPGYRFTYRLRR